jgi:hypothetical protein
MYEKIKMVFELRPDLPWRDRIPAGMALIRKYQPDADAGGEHDVIYFGTYNPDAMTEQERALMEAWGWIEEYDSWAHFT